MPDLACMHGRAGYKVKDGSEGVTARKSVQLWALPRVLVLHLKRFSYGLTGTGKIHKPIAYGDKLRWAAYLRHCMPAASVGRRCLRV